MSMMSAPEAGKWTKLTPCLDWVNGADATCGFLYYLVKASAKPMEFATTMRSGMDQDYAQQVVWHAVAGNMLTESVKMLGDMRLRRMCV